MKTTRIGIDARFYGEGTGISRYTRELLRELGQLDTKTEYLVFLLPRDEKVWHSPGANFRPVFVDAPIFSPQEQSILKKALESAKCDLIHFLNFNHPLFYSGPFVTTYYDLTLYRRPAEKGMKGKLRKGLFRMIFHRAYRSAKAVLPISDWSSKEVQRELGVSKKVIHLATMGAPMPASSYGDRPYKEPYLLFVSAWYSHKGIDTLLNAFAQYHEGHPGSSLQLVLVGKQEKASSQVQKQLSTHPYRDHIQTPGFVSDEDLPTYMHHALAVTVPSRSEGFGLPVLEAYVHGTTVLASNNTSLPEAVGTGGLLIDTEDVGAWAKAFETIFSDSKLRESLIAKGTEHVTHFTWKKCAEATLDTYKSVLGPSSF